MITIPTLSQLYTDVISDLESEYSTSIPLFGKVFLRALAAVQAGKLKIYYLVIGNLQKNIFVDTAEPEIIGGTLERFGRVKLGRNPFPAQAGQYTVEVTGNIGSTVPQGTTFKSNDDSVNPGKLFVLDVAYILVATTDSITIRALEAGLESKLAVGDQLTATAPIAGVNKLVSVTTETVEPLAAEDTEDYRQKAIEAYQLEPQGGAASDYRIWAADAQGVQRVYAYARTGDSAEVNLYVEATVADSTDGKGTPSASLLSDVEDVVEFDPDTTKPLNERGRRPLGVLEVHYLPITVKEITIEITGFVGLTGAIQTQIFNAVKARIDLIRPFVAGADVLEEKDDILSVNTIINTILTVRPGSVFGSVDLMVDAVSVPSWQFVNGDIPFLSSGAITYV